MIYLFFWGENLRKVQKLVLATFIVMLVVALIFPLVEAGKGKGKHKGWLKHPKRKTVVLTDNPFPIWYNYTDWTVRWMANETYALMVNLDVTNDAVGVSHCGIWHYEYGYCFDLGATGGVLYRWACRVGELKIDGPPYEWHIQAPYMEDCEWYGFSLQKTTPPTDFVAILHASNGTHFQPIHDTFSYSYNNGKTWISYTP